LPSANAWVYVSFLHCLASQTPSLQRSDISLDADLHNDVTMNNQYAEYLFHPKGIA
jgi:hypothetical protein